MKRLKVSLHGCDDTTTVEIEVTSRHGYNAIYTLMRAVNDEGGGCQPTMEVAEIKERAA